MKRNAGKVFETDWKKSIDENNQYFLRLQDSPSAFGKDSDVVRFTNHNPYDCFCFYNSHLFPFELKHTKNGSFSIQRDKKEKSKMIKLTQIEGLTKASFYPQVFAGFVFNIFNEENNSNNCYWLNIKNFNRFLKETIKKSINEKDIVEYGGIIVKNEIMISHYKYDVTALLNYLIKSEVKEIG